MEQRKDYLRDSPLRLLGYSNEVGEAFRHVAPRCVQPSYALAFAYCLADTADKSLEAKKREPVPELKTKRMGFAALDTMIWQTLASVAIPGLVINRLVWATRKSLAGATKPHSFPVRWAPTVVGLLAVPFIVHPIDTGVHWAMDRSIRPGLTRLLNLGPDDK